MSIKYEKVLRGRVQFPTGGIVREPLRQKRSRESAAADLVKFQNRQYSLDERRNSSITREDCMLRLLPLIDYPGTDVSGFLSKNFFQHIMTEVSHL